MQDICKTHLLWRGCSPIPCGLVRPHVVTDDTNIYVGGGNLGRMEFTRTVMKYDIVANKWSCLPITAFHTFSLVLINGLITVIGGYNVVTACVSNTLTSFDKGSNKWCMRFPPMLTKRSASSAVAALSHVVVVGGKQLRGHGGGFRHCFYGLEYMLFFSDAGYIHVNCIV